MPHQCTNCGRAFEDGSKEMLSGCPDCGGNKFQFHPSEESVPEEPEPSADPPDPTTADGSVARTVGSAAATVRDLVGGSNEPPEEPAPVAEDAAQASARSEVVSPDEIPASSDDGWTPADRPGTDGSDPATGDPSASTPSPPADRPDLTELREELNDQFESIKVLNPGKYELNLMELYDREEYIIALQEDGRYTIQVPETWHE